MKKILLVVAVVFVSVFMTGCGNKEEKTETRNAELIKEVENSVSNKESIINLQFVDSNILLTSLGLETSDVEDYVGKIPVYNMPEENLYIAIKPSKGNDEKVKRALDLYVSSLETRLTETKIDEATGEHKTVETEAVKTLKAMTKEEYKGYYIYVSSKESAKIVKALKNNLK